MTRSVFMLISKANRFIFFIFYCKYFSSDALVCCCSHNSFACVMMPFAMQYVALKFLLYKAAWVFLVSEKNFQMCKTSWLTDKDCFNPFVRNAPFLYPLKRSENFTVFRCFQGVEKGCIRNKWVNLDSTEKSANYSK